MTICIAAISESKDILAIADKKFTNSLGVTSGYQINENKKIVEVTPKCLALFAGNIVNANEVLAIAKKIIKPTDSVPAVADKIKNAYMQRLRSAINDEILSKFGLDIDSFNAQQKSLDTTFINSVIETINDPNTTLGVQIIVAGKEADGPQLYKVSHPGTITNETPIGYTSTGSGSSHANLSLMASGCHPGTDHAILTYALLKAKKKAEYDPDVGDMSMMALIKDKVDWIDNDVMKKLWKEYENSVKEITAITKKSSTIMIGAINGSSPVQPQ